MVASQSRINRLSSSDGGDGPSLGAERQTLLTSGIRAERRAGQLTLPPVPDFDLVSPRLIEAGRKGEPAAVGAEGHGRDTCRDIRRTVHRWACRSRHPRAGHSPGSSLPRSHKRPRAPPRRGCKRRRSRIRPSTSSRVRRSPVFVSHTSRRPSRTDAWTDASSSIPDLETHRPPPVAKYRPLEAGSNAAAFSPWRRPRRSKTTWPCGRVADQQLALARLTAVIESSRDRRDPISAGAEGHVPDIPLVTAESLLLAMAEPLDQVPFQEPRSGGHSLRCSSATAMLAASNSCRASLTLVTAF